MNRINNLKFVSNSHLRYENGIPVMGIQYCQRTIKVEEKTIGGDYVFSVVLSNVE